MCVRAEKYFCRSIEYDDITKQCTLSEEDSISQKDDIGVSSSPTHHFYDFACLDSPRGSEYPDNSVTSHLFTGKKPDTAFQRFRNSRLGGEHHSEISGRSLSECLDECLRQPSFQCRSAVYSERYRTCRLSRYNQRDGMRIIYDADYDYYENLMLGNDGDNTGSGRPGENGKPDGDRNRPAYRPSYSNNDRYYPKYPYDRPPHERPPLIGEDYYPEDDRFDDRYPIRLDDRYPVGPMRYPDDRDRHPNLDRFRPDDRYNTRYRPSGLDKNDDRYSFIDRYPGYYNRLPDANKDRYGTGERYGVGRPIGSDRYNSLSYYSNGIGDDRHGQGVYDGRDKPTYRPRIRPSAYDDGRSYRPGYRPGYEDRPNYRPVGDIYGGNRYGGSRPNRRPIHLFYDDRPLNDGNSLATINGGYRRPFSPGPDGPIYDNNFGGFGPGRPYSSRCDEGDNFKQVSLQQRVRKDFIRRFLQTTSLSECQRECVEARDFICRSFNFRDGPSQYDGERENCELSDRDSRDMELNNPQYYENTGNFDFYERSNSRQGTDGDCLDVTQVCNEDGMEFTLRTPEGFYGRIYTYGFYDRCFFRGNGGTLNVLRISGAQGYPECGTQRNGDTMTNIVVVQFSDFVQNSS